MTASFFALSNTDIIRLNGEDAAAFLHAQLTSDVAELAIDRSQYSGYCTPKGRLLASFLLWRAADAYYLQLPAELREPVQKRLTQYILRSRVKAEASGELAPFGIAGPGAEAAVAKLVERAPVAVHEAVQRDGVTAIRLPTDRFLVVAPRSRVEEIRAALSQAGPEAPHEFWDRLDIVAGIPVITLATQEEFVPQMVNFDRIGAVSFSKGCYPGQEIVARMHYLGRLKERMYFARLDGHSPPEAGDKLYGADLGGQATGMIVNAAASPGGGHDMLIVARISSVAAGSIRWKAVDGPELKLGTLPYAI
jgi:folate-binding protein YgfZ